MTRVDHLPAQPELSLYVHIPFCTVKCGYCDFFSIADASVPLIRRVVSAILEDTKRLLGAIDPTRVPTVYVGGGTPSVLSMELLAPLLGGIRSELPGDPEEWTVEVNPETVTPELLQGLGESGVTRLSMGVQALGEEGLRSLGRAAGVTRTVDALEEVQRRWEGRWNADLIVGYPGDTHERVVRDAESLLGYGASHLSVYALTVEPGTPLARQVAAGTALLPGDEEVIELLESAENTLSVAGVERYEVSNYARRGEESLHNLRYWRMDPYLGVGPAAASTLYERGSPPLRALRLEGVTPIPLYLAPGGERYRKEELSPRDLLTEHLMMGLRTREGVNLARLAKRFNIPLEELFRAFGDSPEPPSTPLKSSLPEGHPVDETTLLVAQAEVGVEPPRLHVPRHRWNLLDLAVLRAVEKVEGLL